MSPKQNKALKVKVWKKLILSPLEHNSWSLCLLAASADKLYKIEELDSSSAGIVLSWTQILQLSKEMMALSG